MTKLKEQLKSLSLEFPNCNVYTYGSQVYQSVNENSDFDFIVVGPVATTSETRLWGDIHFYSTEDFQEKIKEHEISVLECLFLPEDLKAEVLPPWNFKLDLGQLRVSVSQKSSNSWVKAKKKLTVENEPYLAKKSLFHSLRILSFGIELAQHQKITNYNQSQLWQAVCSLPEDWETWNQAFKSQYNHLKSQFKSVSPK